jgi:hypothetical protein
MSKVITRKGEWKVTTTDMTKVELQQLEQKDLLVLILLELKKHTRHLEDITDLRISDEDLGGRI